MKEQRKRADGLYETALDIMRKARRRKDPRLALQAIGQARLMIGELRACIELAG